MRSKNYRAALLLVLLAVCLNGCGQGSLPLPPETTNTPAAVSATSVHTTTPTLPPSQVVPPPPTATATMQAPTPPFRPTLQPLDAKILVTDLLRGNGNCRLPCIWGIDLQKNSSSEAAAFVLQFGKFTEEDIALSSGIWSGKGKADGGGALIHVWQQDLVLISGFDYYSDKTLLKQLVLHAIAGRTEGNPPDRSKGTRTLYEGSPYFEEQVGYYLLPQFLKREGKPSAVWIYPIQDTIGYKWPFSLLMVYEDKGFMIEYRFNKSVRGENLSGCPEKAGWFTLSAWDPQKKPSLSEILTGYSNNFSVGRSYKPLEETTSMTVDDFYTMYAGEKSTKCITTQQSFWPWIE